MRLKQSLIALSAALSFFGSVAAASTQESQALAIQKTLLYSSLLQQSSAGLPAKAISQASLEFARKEGAPQDLLTLMEDGLQCDESEEAIAQLNERFKEILNRYQINLVSSTILSIYCAEDSEIQIDKLMGEAATAMLLDDAKAEGPDFFASLPTEQRERESLAIKKVLLMYYLYSVENSNRISQEAATQCAKLAEKEGAPLLFAHLLQAVSRTNLPPNDRYELNKLFEKLVEAYRVDRQSLHIYSEVSGISSAQIANLMKEGKLYLSESFKLYPKTTEATTPSEVDGQSARLIKDVRTLAEMLAGIRAENANQIDLALLASLIPSYQTTCNIIHGRDDVMYKKLKELGGNRLAYLSSALKISKQQLQRLFQQKDELPTELQALLVQFL